MDDSIARVALDQGNRPYSIIDLELQGEYIEELPTEDIFHFIQSLAISMKSNIHIKVEYGDNDHHKVEAAIKALALALRESISLDPRKKGVPSSKGMI
jgi:imidazoleglycerol-phosphate dehydratase